MNHHRKVLTLHVPERTGIVNITRDVEAAVKESGIQEGFCLVNSMHKGPVSATEPSEEREHMTRCHMR